MARTGLGGDVGAYDSYSGDKYHRSLSDAKEILDWATMRHRKRKRG